MNKVVSKIVPISIIAIMFFAMGCKKKEQTDLSKAFVKYYGGLKADNASTVLQTSDGGYVIAGTSTNGPSADIIIVKTDADGNESWHQTFGGPNYDECGSVAIMPDGGYILIGTYGITSRVWNVNSLQTSLDSTVMYAVRLDASGNTVWTQQYPYSSPNVKIGTFGKSVVANSNGQCMMAGMVDSSYNTTINLDVFAFLIGTDGTILQVLNTATNTMVPMKPLTYGVSNAADIVYNAIASVTNNNNEYLISSVTNISGLNTPRVIPFRLNGIAFTQSNAPTKSDWLESTVYDGYQLSSTSDNNYVLTGTYGNPSITTSNTNTLTNTNIPTSSSIYMIKLNSSTLSNMNFWTYGNAQGGYFSQGISVIATSDGGYAILANSNDPAFTGNTDKLIDVILIKTDQNGVQQWFQDFGGRGNDAASKLIQTSDGGYLICGTIAFGEDATNTGTSNAMTLIKVDSQGNISNIK
jgi:hypothetical protein